VRGGELIDELPSKAHGGIPMIKALIAGLLIFLLATFPATWLLMLFFGNVGVNVGYWGMLPLGILVSSLLAGVTGSRVTYVGA
jgi:hypothetical protein